MSKVISYNLIKSEALYHSTMDTEVHFWRHICRYYSEHFHTPLIQVYNLSPVHVLQNYYESVFETKFNKDSLISMAIESVCPEIKQELDEGSKLLEEMIMAQEKQRLKSGESFVSAMMKRQKMDALETREQVQSFVKEVKNQETIENPIVMSFEDRGDPEIE